MTGYFRTCSKTGKIRIRAYTALYNRNIIAIALPNLRNPCKILQRDITYLTYSTNLYLGHFLNGLPFLVIFVRFVITQSLKRAPNFSMVINHITSSEKYNSDDIFVQL